MIDPKFQRLYPCFWGRVIRLDYFEECLMCGKEEIKDGGKQKRWVWLLIDAWYSKSCIRRLIKECMTQRIFSQMLLSLVHLLSSFCRSYYQYFAVLFALANGLPICWTVFALISTCSWIPTNWIELAVWIVYLIRTNLVYFILFLFQVGRLHVSWIAVQDYIFPVMILAHTSD